MRQRCRIKPILRNKWVFKGLINGWRLAFTIFTNFTKNSSFSLIFIPTMSFDWKRDSPPTTNGSFHSRQFTETWTLNLAHLYFKRTYSDIGDRSRFFFFFLDILKLSNSWNISLVINHHSSVRLNCDTRASCLVAVCFLSKLSLRLYNKRTTQPIHSIWLGLYFMWVRQSWYSPQWMISLQWFCWPHLDGWLMYLAPVSHLLVGFCGGLVIKPEYMH